VSSVRAILLIEDDPALRRALRTSLRSRDFDVLESATGEDAIVVAADRRPDVVILDLGLPDLDGIEVLRRLRAFSEVPVIVLTARDDQSEKVRSLDAGADDYMTKPFELAELMARLRALARREPVRRPIVLEVGELRLDPATRQVSRGGQPIELPAKCFSLLETFMRHPGVVMSRFDLLESAWEGDYENRSNVVEQHVRALRARIDAPFGVHSIETIRGSGYRLREDGGR
jgi:two-component system OmpR family response regulator